jgi:4-carboxymuconolactone decarboxylase
MPADAGAEAREPSHHWETAMDRMPPLSEAEMTAAQRDAAEHFGATRGTGVFGPFVPLLRSPDLLKPLQQVGAYCRYHSAMGVRLTEFVILMVARRLTQNVEWAIHGPIAREAGISTETMAALLEGRRPNTMAEDEALVHDAIIELWTHHGWCDATYETMLARFGERGIIDLVGTVGYYSTIGMVMNVARTEIPDPFRMPRLPQG